jgi:hypothetical protein
MTQGHRVSSAKRTSNFGTIVLGCFWSYLQTAAESTQELVFYPVPNWPHVSKQRPVADMPMRRASLCLSKINHEHNAPFSKTSLHDTWSSPCGASSPIHSPAAKLAFQHLSAHSGDCRQHGSRNYLVHNLSISKRLVRCLCLRHTKVSLVFSDLIGSNTRLLTYSLSATADNLRPLQVPLCCTAGVQIYSTCSRHSPTDLVSTLVSWTGYCIASGVFITGF